MPNYFAFVLGKNPELSIAEIVSYISARGIRFEIISKEKEFLILKTDFFEPKIDDLGGTLKIASGYYDWKTLNIKDFFDLSRSSITFGLSFYNSRNWEKDKDYIEPCFKNQLREIGIKSGCFHPAENRSYLTHVEVIKKNLISNGEIIFCFSKGKYHIGKTIQVHNPFESQKRDIKRPEQRAIYSIPPRLAKIMINLTGVESGILLDPFCGIGTILQEAALMGFDIKGVDLDKNCIVSARKNLEWLKKEYDLEIKELDKKIINKDSKNLSKYFEKESIDCIVTEPYLGPPLKKSPPKKEVESILKKLDDLYLQVLKEANKILKPKGRVCIISPKIRLDSGATASLDMKKISRLSGFIEIAPLHGISNNYPLTDFEERHRIIREINVLGKS